MKRRILAFLVVLVCVGVTLAVGLLNHPAVDDVLRDLIVSQAATHLKVSLRIGGIERNITLTRVALSDVLITDLAGDGARIHVRRLVIDVDPYALMRNTLAIRDLRLEGASIEVVRKADGSVEVRPIFPFWEREADGPRRGGLKVRIGRVALADIQATYRDVPLGLFARLDGARITVAQDPDDPPDRRSVAVNARSGRFESSAFPEGRGVDIGQILIAFELSEGEAVVSRLKVQSRLFEIEAGGIVPFDRQRAVSASVDLELDVAEVPWAAAGASGKVAVEGRIAGTFEEPTFKGRMTARAVAVGDRAVEDLSSDVALSRSSGSLSSLRGLYRGEPVEGALKVVFNRSLQFTLELRVADYPLERILTEAGAPDTKLTGKADLAFRFEGSLADPKAMGTVGAQGKVGLVLPDGDLHTVEVNLDGKLFGRILDIERMEARTGSLAVAATGQVGPDGPRIRFEGEEPDLSRWPLLPSKERLAGTATVSGEVDGPWKALLVRSDVKVVKPSYGAYRADLAEAHLDLSDAGIACPLGSIKVGSSMVTVVGRLPWDRAARDGQFTLEVPRGRIEDGLGAAGISMDVKGGVSTRLDFVDGRGGWTGSGVADLSDISVYRETAQAVSLVLRIGSGFVLAQRVEIQKDGRQLKGEAAIENGKFSFRLDTKDPLPIESVAALKRLKVDLAGEASVEAVGSGRLDGKDLSVAATLSWDELSFQGRPWRGGKGTCRIKGKTLTATGSLLDGLLDTEVTLSLGGEFPFQGSMTTTAPVSRQDLNDFLGLRLPSVVSGRLKADVTAEGDLSDLDRARIKGTITEAEVSFRRTKYWPVRPLPFLYVPESGITFTDLSLGTGQSRTEGTIRIGPGGSLEGNVNGVLDLTGLSLLEPVVDGFTGSCGIELRVGGSLAKPDLRGFLDFKGVTCTAHLPFPLPVSELGGRMEIVGERMNTSGLSGRTGGGSLSMEGDILLSQWTVSQAELTWQGEGVTVNFPEGLSTVDRARIQLRFGSGKGVLRGTVLMDEGSYRREINIDNLIALVGEKVRSLAATEGEGSAGAAGGGWLALDILMNTERPLDVDIQLVRGTATGSLRLQGTAAKPVLSGRVEMVDGTLQYRNHTFDLSHGSVAFFNPNAIEPHFDFGGRTSVTGFDRDGVVHDYLVDLTATGIPDKFRLMLASEPALNEVDILSLLMWGVVGERAMESLAGLSATETALLLTKQLAGVVESGLERITGFDRVVINPSAVSAKGERSTRVQVDKRLGERLSLTYSTPILSSQEQEVTLRYRITDLLSLVGEQAGEANFGLDLDFSFEIP